MSRVPPPDRHDRELAFFGAVTASLSHQLNNVLSIIGELNGLIEDLVAGAAGTGAVVPERLDGVVRRIAANLARGNEYIRLLNRFAHVPDEAHAEVDLDEMAGLLGGFGRRFAELRQASLEVAVAGERVVVSTAPFRALHLLFLALQEALAADGVRQVRIAPSGDASAPRVRITGDGTAPSGNGASAARVASILALGRELGGAVEVVARGGEYGFELAFAVEPGGEE